MVTNIKKTEHTLVVQPNLNVKGSIVLNFRAIRSNDNDKNEYKFWIGGDLSSSGYLDINDDDLEDIAKFIQAYKAFK